MRPAWLQVPVTHLHWKPLASRSPNQRRFFKVVLIEIKVGMVALDIRKRTWLIRQPILCSRPPTCRPRRRLLQGFIAPLAHAGIGRNIGLDRAVERGKRCRRPR